MASDGYHGLEASIPKEDRVKVYGFIAARFGDDFDAWPDIVYELVEMLFQFQGHDIEITDIPLKQFECIGKYLRDKAKGWCPDGE